MNGRESACRLVPRLGRIATPELGIIERNLYDAFRRSATSLVRNPPADAWEWLALAQHHGLATRLLDWTRNPLAAMWFAAAHRSRSSRGPCIVWAFDPAYTGENSPGTDRDLSPFETHHVLLLDPVINTRRIEAQAGCFTVHPLTPEEDLLRPIDSAFGGDEGYLRSAVVDLRHRESIRDDLVALGINDAMLFPDLDGVSKHLNSKYLAEADAQARDLSPTGFPGAPAPVPVPQTAP